MPDYTITYGGHSYTVSADHELTDDEVMTHVRGIAGDSSAWGNMGHRVAGVREGVADTFNLPAMKEAAGLTKDITAQKAHEGYQGPLGTVADNLRTVGTVLGENARTVKDVAAGGANLLWKLMKPTAPWDVAGGEEKRQAFAGLDPGGAEPDQNPIEKRWRRGTNLAGMVLLNKGMPWSKEADAAKKATQFAKAWDEAHAIQMMTGAQSTGGAAAKLEAQRVAQGLGAPGPRVVKPSGGVTADEQIINGLREGIEEGKAAPVQAGEQGKHLPPPPFSLGAAAAPEQPRWQLLPKEMLEAEEGAPSGPVYGPQLNTVEAPTKTPGSKTAIEKAKAVTAKYEGAERRGPNRIASDVEDAAYEQVRRAQAKKAALGRAQALLGPKEGTGAQAQTAAKIEAEIAAGHTAPGEPGKVVNLPVATPEEAAPALAPVSNLQTRMKAWQDKWKSLTGKARRDLESNIPSDVKQAMEDQLNKQGNPAPGIRKALGMGPLKPPQLVKPGAAPALEGPGMGLGAPPQGAGAGVASGIGSAQPLIPSDKQALLNAIMRRVGGDKQKAEALLRQEIGGTATERVLGTPQASTGRLPQQAVDRLKAAADKEIAETGQMSRRTAEALARAAREEAEHGPFTAYGGVPDFTGFVKAHPVLAGGVAGGALGYSMSGDEDSTDISLAKALAGAGLGAGLAAGATNLPKVLSTGMGLRREGFLSGGAIPKNIMTAAGAPAHIATDVGLTQGVSAAKEMFNLPKNVQEFVSQLKNPGVSDYTASSGAHFGMLAPSNVISAIDATATKALQRAGISEEDIQRVLLTKKRDMLGPDTSKAAREASRFLLPFQRVPWNVFKESLEEMGHMWGDFKTAHETISGVVKGDLPLSAAKKAIPSLRTGADLGALAGGYGLGEWAGNDPKKKYALSILLAAFGPRQAFGIMGAVAGLGTQGLAAGAVGGISPIPEQAFDLRALLGMKPAALSAYEKLSGNKIEY